jgi:hypothetical protein
LKNLLSILLLGLLIFNTIGFSVYTIFEQIKAEEKSEPSDPSDLVLKFPLTLPYLTQWESQEPSNEELLKGNEYYRIVSRQIIRDTLYVKCAFSQTARERFWSLVSTFDDQIKQDAGTPKDFPSSLLKDFVKEYMALSRTHTFYILEWCAASSFPPVTDYPSPADLSISTPPPNRAKYI